MIFSYQENRTMRCIKYTLSAFCFLFMITGVVMVVLGTTINAVYRDYSYFLEQQFFSPAALVVAVGFITLGVSLLGAMGAVRESVCLIMSFVACLCVIFVLELTAAITGFVLMNELGAALKNMLSSTMENYYDVPEANNIVDILQSEVRCCGVESPSDWQIFTPPHQGVLHGVYPASCYTDTMKHTRGCLPSIEAVLKEGGLLLATSALLITCIQLTGIVLAYNLGKQLRQEKTAREYRRWVLREELMKSADIFYSHLPEEKTGQQRPLN